MSFAEYATYREIKSQTAAWSQALDLTRVAQLPSPEAYDQVLFTGCGSTYYLSQAAASLYQQLTGRTARSLPAGELLLNPQVCVEQDAIPPHKKTLLVAISRSGTTTETVKAVEEFMAEQRNTLGNGLNPGKPKNLAAVVVQEKYDE